LVRQLRGPAFIRGLHSHQQTARLAKPLPQWFATLRVAILRKKATAESIFLPDDDVPFHIPRLARTHTKDTPLIRVLVYSEEMESVCQQRCCT
jgi:hypothetical protein